MLRHIAAAPNGILFGVSTSLPMENVKWDKVDKIDIFFFLKIIFYKPMSSDVAAAGRISIASHTHFHNSIRNGCLSTLWMDVLPRCHCIQRRCGRKKNFGFVVWTRAIERNTDLLCYRTHTAMNQEVNNCLTSDDRVKAWKKKNGKQQLNNKSIRYK